MNKFSLFLTISIFSAAVLFSCKKSSEENRPINLAELAGNWEQQFQPYECGFGCAKYTFQFDTSGHFQAKVKRSSDIIDPTNPCPNSRTNYAAGTVQLNAMNINLDGIYTASDYTTPEADCQFGAFFTASAEYTYIGGELTILASSLFPGGVVRLRKQ